MKIAGFLLILSLLGAVPKSHADILFVDFNGAVDERAAAEAAAKARGEKLIVIPKVTKEEQTQSAALLVSLGKTQKAIAANCDGQRSGAACTDLYKQRVALQDKLLDFQGKANLNDDLLAATADQLAKDGTHISSMVISGHDGNGNFTGLNGTLSSSSFVKMSQASPEVFKDMRGLMLWGCYTSTPGQVYTTWKPAFPNVEMVAGYDGRAPLANSPSSSVFLQDVLSKEKFLTEEKDRATLQKDFNDLQDVNNVNGAMALFSGANCVDGLYVSRGGVQDKESLKAMCKNLPTDKWTERFNCYKAGMKGCTDVPKDTSFGELRLLYNDIQTHSHCSAMAPEENVHLPNSEETLRLLFFKEVVKNFASIHGKDIEGLDASLAKLGAPANLRLRGMEKLSRADLIKRLTDIDNFLTLRAKSIGPLQDKLLPEQMHAQDMLKGISQTLNDVSPKCSPFSWVEPQGKGRSECVIAASPAQYIASAENKRAQVMKEGLEKNIANLVSQDKEWLALKEKIKNDSSPQLDKIEEEIQTMSKTLSQRYAGEIQKLAATQRQDLKQQTPVVKISGSNRDGLLQSLETGNLAQDLVQSNLNEECQPVLMALRHGG